MNKPIPNKLTDDEAKDLAQLIAKPAFNYFLKRMQRILLNGKYSHLSINEFTSIFWMAMGNIDGNLIRWLAAFFSKKTGKPAPYEGLKNHYYLVLKEHCEAKIGKN